MTEQSKSETPNLVYSEYSNAQLIEAVIHRVRHAASSREGSLAITKLHEALLWLGTPLTELPRGVSHG